MSLPLAGYPEAFFVFSVDLRPVELLPNPVGAVPAAPTPNVLDPSDTDVATRFPLEFFWPKTVTVSPGLRSLNDDFLLI